MNYLKSPLRQEGNKYSYLGELFSFFPSHKIYIEPFCGTAVVGINNDMPEVKIMNDHNKLIYWLFMILGTKRGKAELIKAIENIPVYLPILKSGYPAEDRLVDRIAKMIIMAKTTLYGRGETIKLRLEAVDTAEDIKMFKSACIKKCKWTNKDFRGFLKAINFRQRNEELSTFVYCDPPYVAEKGKLKSNRGFKESDMDDLYELLSAKEWNFAISCREDSANFWAKKGLYIEKIAKINCGFKSQLGGYEYLAMNYRIQPELF